MTRLKTCTGAGIVLLAALALAGTACTGTSKPSAEDGATAERPGPQARGKAKANRPPRGKADRDGPPPGAPVQAETTAATATAPNVVTSAADAPQLAFNNARALMVDDDGTAHAVWLDGRDVVYQRSGRSGSGDKQVIGQTDTFGATLAHAGSTVLVAWPAGRKGLEYVYSKDGGKRWSKAAVLSGTQGMARNPSMFAWTDGGKEHAALAWHVVDRGSGRGPGGHDDVDAEIWAATWADGSWTKPTRLDGAPGHSAFVTVFGSDDGKDVMAMWRDGRDGDRTKHIYAMDLDPSSGKWSGERDVGLEGLDPGACIDAEGRIHAAFHDKLTMFYARSTDGGKRFSDPVPLDPSKKGYFGHAACAGDTVAISWERMMEPGGFKDDSKKAVGLAVSKNGGKSFDVIDVQGGQRALIQAAVDLHSDGDVALLYVDRRDNTVVMGSLDH